MIIYSGVKADFLRAVETETIADEIRMNILNKMHRHTPINEYRAFENSMKYMYMVMNDEDIPNNAGVAIEYNIPQTAKRVDFVVSGYDKDNASNVVIIELKQWDRVNSIKSQDALVETYVGGGLRKVVHPSYQAWSYKVLIEDYNSTVQDQCIGLSACAYLHNYQKSTNDALEEVQYQEYLDEAPIFCKGDINKLREFIEKTIVYGDNKKVLYEIENGKIRPSKSLQDSIKLMIEGNREFVMLDEQKVAYEEILTASVDSNKDHKKRTIIVKGGPGTGKSVIAINLLSKLTQEGLFAQYTTKNSSLRSVIAKKLTGHKKNSINNMFKGSGSYYDLDSNVIDVILCDEAHRLNKKSGMYQNFGENQVKEIINSSLCSVFFIDEYQKISLKDIGTIAEIKKWAKQLNSEVSEYELISQFRCNGSDGYLSWLDNTLMIKETANIDMVDIDFDIRIVDSASELKDLIFKKNLINNKARILAGYCWNWNKATRNDTMVYDIVLDDFGMSWNLENTTTYAIDSDSVNEVGCIHSSQGLEFDYVGVIIGDDMRYENGQIVTDFKLRASTDHSLNGIKSLYKENPEKALKEADEIIKNTYRTLMTRGMKGCYVYCTDANLREYLKKSIGDKNEARNN